MRCLFDYPGLQDRHVGVFTKQQHLDFFNVVQEEARATADTAATHLNARPSSGLSSSAGIQNWLEGAVSGNMKLAVAVCVTDMLPMGQVASVMGCAGVYKAPRHLCEIASNSKDCKN